MPTFDLDVDGRVDRDDGSRGVQVVRLECSAPGGGGGERHPGLSQGGGAPQLAPPCPRKNIHICGFIVTLKK